MPKKKSVNPLAVGLGVALGAAGALFLSKKENQAKVKKAVKKVQLEDLVENVVAFLNKDLLDGQKPAVKSQKKAVKPRKSR